MKKIQCRRCRGKGFNFKGAGITEADRCKCDRCDGTGMQDDTPAKKIVQRPSKHLRKDAGMDILSRVEAV